MNNKSEKVYKLMENHRMFAWLNNVNFFKNTLKKTLQNYDNKINTFRMLVEIKGT